MRRSVVIAAGLVLVLVLVSGGVAVRQFANDAEAPAPTVAPTVTHTPTATPTSTPTPTATPSGQSYTNPETGLSCHNVITQDEIEAVGANDKLTIPLQPCTRMLKPPAYEPFSRGESALYFVEEGSSIVSPVDGVLTKSDPAPTGLLYGGGAIVNVTRPDYSMAVLYTWHGEFDDALFGKEVKRGEVIGKVGLPLPEKSTKSGADLKMTFQGSTGFARISALDQYWAGGQQNFHLPYLP